MRQYVQIDDEGIVNAVVQVIRGSSEPQELIEIEPYNKITIITKYRNGRFYEVETEEVEEGGRRVRRARLNRDGEAIFSRSYARHIRRTERQERKDEAREARQAEREKQKEAKEAVKDEKREAREEAKSERQKQRQERQAERKEAREERQAEKQAVEVVSDERVE